MSRNSRFPRLRTALLSALLAVAGGGSLSAEIIEVSDLRIERRADTADIARSSAIRDAELAALAEVRSIMGLEEELSTDGPHLSAAWFNIEEERIAPGYYSGVFRFGVDVTWDEEPTVGAIAASGEELKVDWVLAIPVHFAPDRSEPSVWDPEDVWTRRWTMPPMSGNLLMIANVADDEDREVLRERTESGNYDDMLAGFALKYGAPAAALLILDRSRTSWGNVRATLSIDYWHPATGISSASADLGTDVDMTLAITLATQQATNIVAELADLQQLEVAAAARSEILIPLNMSFAHISEWTVCEEQIRQIPGAQIVDVHIEQRSVSAMVLWEGSHAGFVSELDALGLIGGS